MATTNPYEIERLRRRDAMIAEAARLAELSHTEETTAQTIESVIAQRDEAHDACSRILQERDTCAREHDELVQQLQQQLQIAQAEIERLSHQPKFDDL